MIDEIVLAQSIAAIIMGTQSIITCINSGFYLGAVIMAPSTISGLILGSIIIYHKAKHKEDKTQ